MVSGVTTQIIEYSRPASAKVRIPRKVRLSVQLPARSRRLRFSGPGPSTLTPISNPQAVNSSHHRWLISVAFVWIS